MVQPLKEILSILKRACTGCEAVIEKNVKWEEGESFGDVSFACFEIAKMLGKRPHEVAISLKKKVEKDMPIFIRKVEAKGAFLNFFLNWGVVGNEVLREVLEKKDAYGSEKMGEGKTIVIDYSAPNIAKPLSISHLRGTLLGNSLYRIYKFLGYRCISDLHQGDWGTQFGKLILAYKLWGDEKMLEKKPIEHMLELYVKFHRECEKNKKIEDDAREEFRKLENGDRENITLWKKFSIASMREFERVYKMLGIGFDLKLGESFYVNEGKRLVREMLSKGIAERSEDAVVVNLERYSLPVLVVQKSDESTLYQTRDLATIKYREERFNPFRIIYVVGNEQKLYFQQVFKVAELLGFNAGKYVHVGFGLLLMEGEKLSTRKGKIIMLEDVLERAFRIAKDIIREKNPEIKESEEIARKVALCAVKFANFTHSRRKDITFEWGKAMSFEGRSGPYIMYTYVRAISILRKHGKEIKNFDARVLKDEREARIIKDILAFKQAIIKSAESYDPHYLAEYLFQACNRFNEFYQNIRVLSEPDEKKRAARLALVKAFSQVVKNALNLLGIDVVERM